MPFSSPFVKPVTATVICWLIATVLASNACGQPNEVRPPVASKIPHPLELHGVKRIDDYYWLRDRDDAAVISYLDGENAYLEAVMGPTQDLQGRLFQEIKGRIKQDDTSVPYPEAGYEYYSRTEEGKQYSIYCRRRMNDAAKPDKDHSEEITLDVNQLADGKPFCSVSGVKVSPDSNILAYAVDFVGRRKYTLQFKDLSAGTSLTDEIRDVTGNFVWAEDNRTIFYTRQDPETLRAHQVYRHLLGTDPAGDVLVYEEPDVEFNCFVSKSRSRQYILIGSHQTLSSEYRLINAEAPTEPPIVFSPREPNHEYSLDHLGDHCYVRTNWDATNFRLMRVPDQDRHRSGWVDVVPASHDEYLASFALFDSFIAVQLRSEGMVKIRIMDRQGNVSHELDFGEPCFVAFLAPTEDPSTKWLRYGYSSLTTPPSTLDYHVETREKRLLKQQEILGGFDKNDYVSQRRFVTARDGVSIPVSIVYHKATPLDGTAPCLQYGYGSYGSSMDPHFDAVRLNLLNRGFVYAIAHIRGGQEMGRAWYEQGKLLKKMNTFTDFIDVGEYLIAEGFASPDKLFARGGSAGGLLIGAVINLRPDLYHGVIADVPFVDVVTTMLDESIPLTTNEYDEWGNPNREEYFRYMLAYSPYDNIRPRRYPHVLVTAGLHDSQVQYWEPAKWVARLREHNLSDRWVLMRTNMGAGHGGASGRYDRYQEAALRDAFLLMLAGRAD